MKGVDDHMSFRVSRNFMSAMLGIGSRSTGSRTHRMSSLQSTGANRFLNTTKTNKTNGGNATVYQNMKQNAGEVQSIASKLTKTGEGSLFAKARENGSTAGIVSEVKDFVNK